MVRILAAGAAFLALSAAGWSAASGATPYVPAAAASAGALVVSQGDVIVMAAPNGRDLIVALDGDEGAPDGTSDRVFLLQRNEEVNASLAGPRVLREAVVQYDQRRLQVIHESFSGSFSVGEPDGPGERFSTAGPRVLGELQVAVLGYGLQRSSGRWTMSEAGLAEGADQGFGCGGGSGSFLALATDNCAAGGQGATQCSLDIGGGCSVSCGAGYYACCNVMGGCKCRVEPT